MNKEQNLNEPQNQQLNIAGVSNSISFREMAEKLWDLLDDIDTASDMFKPSDEKSAMAFYRYAMSKQAERHKYLKSDGYKLYTNEEFEQLPKSKPQFGVMENEKVSKVKETQQLNIFAVSTRLFGVYDRNGNIKSVYREPYNAFEEATKLNRQLAKDEYFIDWVIVG